MLEKVKKINFKVNVIIAHGDINRANVLFNKNKLSGILDFDNLKFAPKAEDVAYSLRMFCPSSIEGVNKKSMTLFLREYRKIMPLSKKEERLLIPLMIRGIVNNFWWMYMNMKKGQDIKHKIIESGINQTKNLAKQIGWLK
jgi:Ser/Thr protein kinase RdoA (MazF antagonist)